MTLDLDTIFPQKDYEGKGREIRSYKRTPGLYGFEACITEERLDVFEELSRVVLAYFNRQPKPSWAMKKDPGILHIAADSGSILDNNGLDYRMLITMDTPGRHETFTMPAIRHLFTIGACSERGLSAMLIQAIENLNDLTKLIKTDPEQAKQHSGINSLKTIRQLLEYERSAQERIPIENDCFRAALECKSFMPLDILVNAFGHKLPPHLLETEISGWSRREDYIDQEFVRRDPQIELERLIEHIKFLPPEDRKGLLVYARNVYTAELLIEMGAEVTWHNKKGQSCMEILQEIKEAKHVVDYLAAEYGHAYDKRDAQMVAGYMDRDDGQGFLRMLINAQTEITPKTFETAARIQQMASKEFFAALPEEIQNSQYMNTVRIGLIQTSAAEQADRLSDTRDGAKHAEPERGDRNG